MARVYNVWLSKLVDQLFVYNHFTECIKLWIWYYCINCLICVIVCGPCVFCVWELVSVIGSWHSWCLAVTSAVIVVTLQCREIAVNSHNEMTKVATELHSVSNSTCFLWPLRRRWGLYILPLNFFFVTHRYSRETTQRRPVKSISVVRS